MSGTRPDLVRLDEILVGRFDASIAAGAVIAGKHLTCRLGCSECCSGLFDITALDALRLRRGLRELEEREPAVAGGIRERAHRQWSRIAARFPGDPRSGELAADEEARERFWEEFSDVRCPALDEATGACLLYGHRPLTCRSYGLPMRFGDDDLPPCHLNFQEATERERELARVEPDPEDLEGAILLEMDEPRDTVIAAVLSLPSDEV